MRIEITNDDGKRFAKHEFADDKLKNFCNALNEADGSDAQKAMAFLDFMESVTKKIDDDVSKYVNKLMGWS